MTNKKCTTSTKPVGFFLEEEDNWDEVFFKCKAVKNGREDTVGTQRRVK